MSVKLNLARIVAGLLLTVLMVSLARSIEQAGWTSGLYILTAIAVSGVVIGVILAGSELASWRAHILGAVGGGVIVMWQTGRVLMESEVTNGSRFATVWMRLREWLSTVLEGGTSRDELLFVFTMGAIVWFLSYNSAWFVIRYTWAWWAVLPAGIVMLVNLGYAIRPNYTPFITFLLCSLMLVIQTQFMRSSARWQEQGLGYDRGLGARLFLVGAAASVSLMFLAWQAPSNSLAVSARAAYERIEQPWQVVHDRWKNAFGFLYPSANRPPATSLGGGFTSFDDSFKLGGPLSMGNRRLFTAITDIGQYWKAVSYDTYAGGRWTSWADDSGYADAGRITAPRLPGRQLAAQEELPPGIDRVDQEVTVVQPVGRSLFAADTPILVNRMAEWEVGLQTKRVSVPVNGELTAEQLNSRGAELERLRTLIREIGPANVRRASPDGVTIVRPSQMTLPDSAAAPDAEASPEAVQTAEAERELLRERQNLLRIEFRGLQARGIEGRYVWQRNRRPTISYTYVTPNTQDQVSLVSSQPLRAGDKYTAVSIVASPTDRQLNTVKGKPPAWVTERYLSVPETVPPRVRRLALEITANADTTHEKASAIEDYLRVMKYREDMPYTPAGRDFVDYFLFDLKEGYCTYYSSAMSVMLRSIGIPSRVVTGFAPGTYNDRIGEYEVTEAQAHAWPEVYYQGFGWVIYEPTPIRDEVSRSDASAAPGDSVGSSLDPAMKDVDEAFNRRAVSGAADLGGVGGLPLAVRLVVAVLIGLAAAFVLIYVAGVVRLRGLTGASRQYAKLTQVGTAIGVAPTLTQTPNEYGARFGTKLPRVDSSVRRITSQYVAEIFGRRRPDADELRGEWRTVAAEAARTTPSRLSVVLRTWLASVRQGRPNKG